MFKQIEGVIGTIHYINGKERNFYLMTYSTHFIYGYMAYIRHMVKYYSDSERKPAAATVATLSD